jgi:hypothetical protein
MMHVNMNLQAFAAMVLLVVRFNLIAVCALLLGITGSNYADAALPVATFVVPTRYSSITGTYSNNLCSKQTTTQLSFGIPSFLTPPAPKDDDSKSEDKKDSKEEKSVGLKGLVQLIMAGAGAPFLGDYEGIDKETGKFMFSLEANNLVDKDGKSKQTSMPYFENGWVDPADLEKEEQRKKNGGGFKLPW